MHAVEQPQAHSRSQRPCSLRGIPNHPSFFCRSDDRFLGLLLQHNPGFPYETPSCSVFPAHQTGFRRIHFEVQSVLRILRRHAGTADCTPIDLRLMQDRRFLEPVFAHRVLRHSENHDCIPSRCHRSYPSDMRFLAGLFFGRIRSCIRSLRHNPFRRHCLRPGQEAAFLRAKPRVSGTNKDCSAQTR